VYDFGQQGDQFFLVMELVEGRTVAAEIAERGSLPKERAIEIVEQSAAGLAAAHQQDVVHRDVKPGNLLLTPDGMVKVADFGIAHLAGDGATTLTAPDQIIGSTRYLAPERARGGQAGKPADVYALGCVLYELVTGQPPFTGEHPAAILYQHVDAQPEPPSTTHPELAGVFETVLLQMLAKDPATRPTAAEIASGALRAPSYEARTTAPLPVDARTTAAAPVLLGVTGPVDQPRSAADRSRRQVWLAAGIAVLAAAAATAAVLLLNNNGPNLPSTNDVGPQPGVTSSTPNAGPITAPTRGQTSGTQTTQTPTPTPSQSTSPSPTPSPTPSTTSPSPSPSPTPTPTRTTPSPTPTTSPSPTSSPPANTPSPGTQ
jgi:serine/threonine-protein kinase